MIIKPLEDECAYFQSTMTIKGGSSSQACAACKYQRRRCNKDCQLAPHFPADQSAVFQNAHRLYGVSNITKILKLTHPDQKSEAMRSVIYESNMRAKFPVTGCLGVIQNLWYQIQQVYNELRCIRSHLSMYQYTSGSNSSPSSQLQLGIQTNDDNEAMQEYQYYQYAPNGGGVSEYLANGINEIDIGDGDEVKAMRVQEVYYGNGSSNGDVGMMQHNVMGASTTQGFLGQQEMDVPHDYHDIPFDTIVDDPQSYVESKETCELLSAESVFNGTHSLEHVSQNDLQSAAVCFSLTSQYGTALEGN